MSEVKALQELVSKRAERDYNDLVDNLIKTESIMYIVRTAYTTACWNEVRYLLINRAYKLDEDTLYAITICPINVIRLITQYYINHVDEGEMSPFGGHDILDVTKRAIRKIAPKEKGR